MYDSYEPEDDIDETACWYEWVTLIPVFVLILSLEAAIAFQVMHWLGVEPPEPLHSIVRWLS